MQLQTKHSVGHCDVELKLHKTF